MIERARKKLKRNILIFKAIINLLKNKYFPLLKQNIRKKLLLFGQVIRLLRKKYPVFLTIALIASVGVIGLSGYGIHAIAATKTARVVGFADRATSGLRVAQLCEVTTSGFAADAKLQYSYTTNYSDKISIFNSSNLSYAGSKSGKSLSGDGYAWFALYGSGATSASVNITVKDVNPDSKTYQSTASASYSNFKKSDFVKDLEAGSYAMFLGDSVSLRDIYGAGGLTHVGCACVCVSKLTYPQGNPGYCNEEFYKYTVSMPWPFSDIVYTDYTMTALDAGVGKLVPIRVYATADGCSFHTDDRGYATTYIRIFNKVYSKSTLHTITLRGGTEKGVTYTINGESIVCKANGQELVFGTKTPLPADTSFNCELKDNVNGKEIKTYINVKTTNTCYVTFDANGIEGYNGGSELVTYKTTISQYPNYAAPEAYGYDFAGWYDNPSCTGKNYLTTPVVEEYMTLYAKWIPREYKVWTNLSLDGNAFPNAKVTLCQNGKVKYTLARDTSKDGKEGNSSYYYVNDVPFSSYVNVAGKIYSYDIYINGRDSGLNCFLDGSKAAKSEMPQQVYCTTVYVDLTNDGAAWSGQKAVIDNGGLQTYTLTDAGALNGAQRYSYIFAFDTTSPKNINDFSVYINDTLMQDWQDGSCQTKAATKIALDTTTSAHGVQIDFYTVKVDAQKDDQSWRDAEITLKQGGTVMNTLIYNVWTSQYEVQVNSKFAYDLYVKNVYTGEDTALDISRDNKEIELAYYTVSFVDSENLSTVYYQQIIECLPGEKRAMKPVAPYKEGKTFMGWYTAREEGTQIFTTSKVTEPITETTTYYAAWKTPSLIIGDYIKCTPTGVQDGRGVQYRLANLAITGYPEASDDQPMITAVVSVNRDGSRKDEITIKGNTTATNQTIGVTKDYQFTYDGKTYQYSLKKTNGAVTGKSDELDANTYTFYLYHMDGSSKKSGWPGKVTQEFLKTQLIIKPVGEAGNNEEEHFCEVKVFGTTATSN